MLQLTQLTIFQLFIHFFVQLFFKQTELVDFFRDHLGNCLLDWACNINFGVDHGNYRFEFAHVTLHMNFLTLTIFVKALKHILVGAFFIETHLNSGFMLATLEMNLSGGYADCGTAE